MNKLKRTFKATSEVLKGLLHKHHKDDHVTFYEITHGLHERGFGILLAFFALPTATPFIPPPLPSIAAIPLLFFGVQMVMERDSPWLPKKIGNLKISRRTLALVIEKTAPFLRRVERVLKERWTFASTPTGERVIGVACCIFAISIAVPFPFTNLLPSIGIVIMSLGLLSKDGVLVVIGMIIGFIGVAMTTTVIIVGVEAAKQLFDWLPDDAAP